MQVAEDEVVENPKKVYENVWKQIRSLHKSNNHGQL